MFYLLMGILAFVLIKTIVSFYKGDEKKIEVTHMNNYINSDGLGWYTMSLILSYCNENDGTCMLLTKRYYAGMLDRFRMRRCPQHGTFDCAHRQQTKKKNNEDGDAEGTTNDATSDDANANDDTNVKEETKRDENENEKNDSDSKEKNNDSSNKDSSNEAGSDDNTKISEGDNDKEGIGDTNNNSNDNNAPTAEAPAAAANGNKKEKKRHRYQVQKQQDPHVRLDRLNTRRLFDRIKLDKKDNNKEDKKGNKTKKKKLFPKNMSTREIAIAEWKDFQRNDASTVFISPKLELLRFINRSIDVDHKLYNQGITVVASYPRSGNTLSRTLLERVTGIVSGSDMNCPDLADDHDVVGESLTYLNFTPFVKTHFPERQGSRPFVASRAILLVRNPWDAIDSYWNLMTTSKHTESVCDSIYEKHHDKLTEMIQNEIKMWNDFLYYWLNTDIPKIFVRYEDLVQNPTHCMTEIMKFTLGKKDVSELPPGLLRRVHHATETSKHSNNDSGGINTAELGSYKPRSSTGVKDIGKSLKKQHLYTDLNRKYVHQLSAGFASDLEDENGNILKVEGDDEEAKKKEEEGAEAKKEDETAEEEKKEDTTEKEQEEEKKEEIPEEEEKKEEEEVVVVEEEKKEEIAEEKKEEGAEVVEKKEETVDEDAKNEEDPAENKEEKKEDIAKEEEEEKKEEDVAKKDEGGKKELSEEERKKRMEEYEKKREIARQKWLRSQHVERKKMYEKFGNMLQKFGYDIEEQGFPKNFHEGKAPPPLEPIMGVGHDGNFVRVNTGKLVRPRQCPFGPAMGAWRNKITEGKGFPTKSKKGKNKKGEEEKEKKEEGEEKKEEDENVKNEETKELDAKKDVAEDEKKEEDIVVVAEDEKKEDEVDEEEIKGKYDITEEERAQGAALEG